MRFVLLFVVLLAGCVRTDRVKLPLSDPSSDYPSASIVDADGTALKFGTEVKVIDGFYEGLTGKVWSARGGTVTVAIDTVGHVSEGEWIEAKMQFPAKHIRAISKGE